MPLNRCKRWSYADLGRMAERGEVAKILAGSTWGSWAKWCRINEIGAEVKILAHWPETWPVLRRMQTVDQSGKVDSGCPISGKVDVSPALSGENQAKGGGYVG